MPRRTGWFVQIEAVNGSRMWHPVDTATQALTAIRRLAPSVPLTSTWSVVWREG